MPKFTTTGWAGATGYTGEQTDPTSGLNLYYARAYDPMAGTWLSSDPTSGTLTDPGSQNHYGYAGANPTTNIDVLGFKSTSLLGAVSGFFTAAAKAVGSVVTSAVSKVASFFGQSAKSISNTAQAVASVVTAEATRAVKAAQAKNNKASNNSEVPPRHALSGWDTFIQFPGNTVEGVILAAADTVVSLWADSPINYLTQAIYLGPQKLCKTGTPRSRVMCWVLLRQRRIRDRPFSLWGRTSLPGTNGRPTQATRSVPLSSTSRVLPYLAAESQRKSSQHEKLHNSRRTPPD